MTNELLSDSQPFFDALFRAANSYLSLELASISSPLLSRDSRVRSSQGFLKPPLEPDSANPPVIGYYLDYDSEESAFKRAGIWAPSVSAFALDYFLSYLQSPGGGFRVRQSSEYFDRDKLLADFGEPSHFGHLELFHSNGVLVVLGGLPASWWHNVIDVEIQTQRPFKHLPPSVQALVKDAHVTHGGLHKYR